jgi:hypothetical protein
MFSFGGAGDVPLPLEVKAWFVDMSDPSADAEHARRTLFPTITRDMFAALARAALDTATINEFAKYMAESGIDSVYIAHCFDRLSSDPAALVR